MAGICALSAALRQKGTETVFVFPPRAKDRDYVTLLQKDGYAVYFQPKGLPATVRLFRQILRKHEVRLVHSHFIDSESYVPLRIATFGKKIPHFFHAHSLPKFPATGWKTALRRRLLHADTMLCVSDAVRNAYTACGFDHCVTVPNGIDFQRLHEGMRIDNPSPSVLMFGYDFRIKGIDTALNALDFFDPMHRYTLRICVANHRDAAEDFLRNRFGQIPPWVELLEPRSDVGTYYQSSDIFLSASRTEGMPYAVLEAAYCGLPLVLSNIAPHKELALPQMELFPAEDQKALFQALHRAESLPKGMNTRTVCEQYSMDRWTEQVLALFPDFS